ncbi:Ger(x)C family spore germination protein [Paenibacillus sp. HB172176]|uniref:Ger(x)C family spore germination protein n=1 Tax=Paenibacillus sp. HB172176 TaxID=2493690 RepID=UPI00143CB2A2|nr:Ger(x)C family spore germination protein [Paenibacillus sp. HB172176]
MRHVATTIIITMVCSLLLTGCWSKYELTELGFVMGVALDEGENGHIKMLTQIYRPSSAESKNAATTRASSVNIKTEDTSIMEAIRDIPIHLGRKAQWSHMRVIIVGEKLAKKTDIARLLDLFYRDHEPRGSIKLLISKGEAATFFESNPMIEQTISQQFLRSEESASINSEKTVNSNLLDLMRQLKSVQNKAIVAYIYKDKQMKDLFSTAGLALLNNGMMKAVMPSSKVEGFKLLRNKYNSGVIEMKCPGEKELKESVEVLNVDVALKPRLSQDTLVVNVSVKGDLAIGELTCSTIESMKEEKAFLDRVSKAIQVQMEDTLAFLQKNKMDVIGVGNHIYRNNPKAWQGVEKDWDQIFADAEFQIRIKLRLVTGGAYRAKPA